jgi:hypothetical protein
MTLEPVFQCITNLCTISGNYGIKHIASNMIEEWLLPCLLMCNGVKYLVKVNNLGTAIHSLGVLMFWKSKIWGKYHSG